MAIQFDEVNDYFAIADSGEMTLQNGDWCVGIWTRVTDNAGTLYQYAYSNGPFGSNGSINLYMSEDAQADANIRNRWAIQINNSSGQVLASSSTHLSAPYGTDGEDRLIIVQRRSGKIELITCAFGENAVVEASETPANTLTALNGGAWNIGRRTDGNADRYYGGVASEFFKFNASLSVEKITALGAGVPLLLSGLPLDVYLPMTTSEATLKDLVSTNDATRSSAPTTVEHPLIMSQPNIYVNYNIVLSDVIYERTLSDSANATDQQQAYEEKLRAIFSSLEVSDIVQSSKLLNRILGSDLSVSDSIISIVATIYEVILSSGLNVNDAVTTQKEIERLLINSLVIIDSVLADKNIFRLLSNNLDLVDSIVRSIVGAPQIYSRILSDNPDIQDAIIIATTGQVVKLILSMITNTYDIITDIKSSDIIIGSEDI